MSYNGNTTSCFLHSYAPSMTPRFCKAQFSLLFCRITVYCSPFMEKKNYWLSATQHCYLGTEFHLNLICIKCSLNDKCNNNGVIFFCMKLFLCKYATGNKKIWLIHRGFSDIQSSPYVNNINLYVNIYVKKHVYKNIFEEMPRLNRHIVALQHVHIAISWSSCQLEGYSSLVSFSPYSGH